MMTPDAVADVPTGAFNELPHVVTIPITSRIRSVQKVLESGGDAGHVTAARVEGRLYPVDGLDVLSAHRESGLGTVPCVVVDAGSLAEAQLLHVRQSAHGQVNPVVYDDAVSFIRTHMGDGPAAGIENSEYKEIAGLALAPGIRERMSEHITGLGKKIERVPSFLSMFQAISEAKPDFQEKALGKLIRYCDIAARHNGSYTVPGYFTLRETLRQLTPRKRRREPTDDDMARKDSWTDGTPGYYHDPYHNNMYFRCKCMSVRIIDTRKLVVRKPGKETSRAVILDEAGGITMYAIRDDAAEYLNLAAGPPVYYYPLSGGEDGADILISKRRLSDDAVGRVRRALHPSPEEGGGA